MNRLFRAQEVPRPPQTRGAFRRCQSASVPLAALLEVGLIASRKKGTFDCSSPSVADCFVMIHLVTTLVVFADASGCRVSMAGGRDGGVTGERWGHPP